MDFHRIRHTFLWEESLKWKIWGEGQFVIAICYIWHSRPHFGVFDTFVNFIHLTYKFPSHIQYLIVCKAIIVSLVLIGHSQSDPAIWSTITMEYILDPDSCKRDLKPNIIWLISPSYNIFLLEDIFLLIL